MAIFAIDADNGITAYDDAAQIPAEGIVATASTHKELAKATESWPVSRLVEIWNGLAGVPPFGKLKPVKKFTDRKTAVARLWSIIQVLAPQPGAPAPEKTFAEEAIEAFESQPAAAPADPPAKPAARKEPKARGKKAAKPPKATREAKAPREGTAKAKVTEMISRKGGATLDEIMKETGWQPHTVRGFISTLAKKTGLKIESSRREDGARVYEVAR